MADSGLHPAPTTAPAGGADAPVDLRTSIFNTLLGKGLTRNQALGVMYSMAGESGGGFNTNAIGDNNTSFGFGQWHAERADALMNTAKQMGSTWSDPSVQLAHFNNEISGKYAAAIEAVKKGNDSPADATRIWTAQYEAPKVNNWQQRMGAGAQAMSLDPTGNLVFKSGPVPSTAGAAPAAGAPAAAPATSGADDFAAAAKRGDVGGALAALNKGDDKSKGLLGNVGDQMAQQAPAPKQSEMLPTGGGGMGEQGGRAQAGQALLSQLLSQQAQPLSWSTRPFGSNAGPQTQQPGTTLNSWG